MACKLTPALNPLIWEHVNPYGRFRTRHEYPIAASMIQMAPVTLLFGLGQATREDDVE
jgi:hypothetical protein